MTNQDEIGNIETGSTGRVVWYPYGLVSWWDMLLNYCSEMMGLSAVLDVMEQKNRLHYTGDNIKELKTELTARRRLLEKLSPLLEQLNMTTSQVLWTNASNTLDIAWIVGDQVPDNGCLQVCNDNFRSLYDGIKAELKSRVFYYVPEHLRGYYDHNQFPVEVIERFPKATDDMEEAGKCYALGRSTAAAFHLVRVAEHGINLICDNYEICNDGSWGKFLGALRKYAIENKDRKKMLMALHARIAGIKDAWRDDTMHVNRTYSMDQAHELFHAINGFMVELTKPLS